MFSGTLFFKKKNNWLESLSVLFFYLLLISSSKTFSQKKEIFVKTIDELITIDGKSDEKSWSIANEIGDFTQWFPTDSLKATNKTNVKVIRDKENIYLLIN